MPWEGVCGVQPRGLFSKERISCQEKRPEGAGTSRVCKAFQDKYIFVS